MTTERFSAWRSGNCRVNTPRDALCKSLQDPQEQRRRTGTHCLRTRTLSSVPPPPDESHRTEHDNSYEHDSGRADRPCCDAALRGRSSAARNAAMTQPSAATSTLWATHAWRGTRVAAITSSTPAIDRAVHL